MNGQLKCCICFRFTEQIASGDGSFVDVFGEVKPDDTQPRVLRRIGVTGKCLLEVASVITAMKH